MWPPRGTRPAAPAPDLFVAAPDSNSAKGARTPAETVRVCIEGWYGGFIKTFFPDWKDREQDLQGLVGFASKFEDVGDLVAQVALLNGESSDKKAEPEEDMLRLTTIHQSKGLEFPIVFLLGCADGLLPLTRAGPPLGLSPVCRVCVPFGLPGHYAPMRLACCLCSAVGCRSR